MNPVWISAAWFLIGLVLVSVHVVRHRRKMNIASPVIAGAGEAFLFIAIIIGWPIVEGVFLFRKLTKRRGPSL